MKRLVALDMSRGIAILVVILVHRLHYSWSAMAGREAVRAHFHGIEAVFIVLAIAVMTMAGMFYVISGCVNGLMFLSRVRREEGRGVGKLVVGGVLTGVWLLALHFVQRVLLMNGFTSPDGVTPPEYPVGRLIGLIRTGEPAPFYWHQLTEPNTLSVIGWILILVSLLLGFLVRNGGYQKTRRNILVLVLGGAAILLLSPFVKSILYPVYDRYLEADRYLAAAVVGHVTHKFGIFPYLSFGLFGAAAGVLLSREGDRTVLRFLSRASLVWLGIGVLGLLGTVPLDSETYPVVRQVQGACIACLELALFLFLVRFGLKRWDFSPDPLRVRKAWFFPHIKRLAVLTLTVYLLEPVVAEAIDAAVFGALGVSWRGSLVHAWLLALLGALFWVVVLAFWEKAGYMGSVEWQGALVLRKLAGKRSTKLAPRTASPDDAADTKAPSLST